MGVWVEKLKAVRKRLQGYPRTWVESDADGIVVKTERWPFHPFERRARWDEVDTIDAVLRDCYCYHVLGLLLRCSGMKPVVVDDDLPGWDSFLNAIEKHYGGFNRHNLHEAGKCFPGTACFPCWDKTRPVGDLELKRAEKKIVWVNDGSIFFQWE